jgi:hypothetical protein
MLKHSRVSRRFGVPVLIGFLLLVVGYLVAANVATNYAKAQVGQWTRTRPYKAFTLQTITRSSTGDVQNGLYAQRSDGSSVRVRMLGSRRQTRSIDFSNGLKVVMFEGFGLKSTVRDHARFLKWSHMNELLMNAGCAPVNSSMTVLRAENFLGRSVKVIGLNGIPPNEPDLHITTWVDPELDCVTVRHEVLKDGVTVTKEVLSIQEGEPDPALFDVSGGVELSPLEATRRAMATVGLGKCEECEQSAIGSRREDYYRQHRP